MIDFRGPTLLCRVLFPDSSRWVLGVGGSKAKALVRNGKGLRLVVHLSFFQDLDIFLTRISFFEIRCLHVLVILIENHGHYNYFMPIGLRSNKGNL